MQAHSKKKLLDDEKIYWYPSANWKNFTKRQQKKVKTVYTIYDIKKMVKDGTIELPPIQRGFVWKPYQIENLWDSLLRGFPIGCFICKKTENGHIEILDGQQRLTSILLGLSWEGIQDENIYVKHIKEIQEGFKIFLDLKPNKEDKNDHRKYNTRVITKSHPWGYQRSPNNKILDFENIRKAKTKIYNCIDNPDDKNKIHVNYRKDKDGNDVTDKDGNKIIENVYTEKADLDVFFKYGFPYDSCKCINLIDFLKTGTYEKEYKGHIDIEGKEIIQFEGLANVLSTKISFQYIDENSGQTDHKLTGDRESTDGDDKDLDSTEYLFTLINRGGTRVSNDDLNYSLIKSQLMKNNKEDGRKLINEINDSCKNIGISPSRFVMICYFLWKWDEEIKKKPDQSISLYIGPREFRNSMQDINNQKNFKIFLEKHKNAEWLIEAKDLMVCESVGEQNSEYKNQNGIPYVWFLDILQQNFYLTFLICYLRKRQIKTNIVPLVTILAIFGSHKYQQQPLRKLVESFVKDIKNDNDMEDKNLRKFFQEHEDLMTQPLNYKNIKNKYNYENSPDNNKFYESNNENDYSNNFGYYIKWKKELLLYAQREFLAKQFDKGKFTLDDMNRPFDYDHIFPAKYRQRNNCANWDTIGNFRAWPYDMNRSDGEGLPCKKFKQKDAEGNVLPIYDEDLLKDSFCYVKKCGDDDEDEYNYDFKNQFEEITSEEELKKRKRGIAEGVIRKRILLIYKEWYTSLNIGAFFEDKEKTQS